MLKNIISITEYNATHNIIILFGIKIKFPKREFVKVQKQFPYETYKKNNVPITTIPPAEGQLRDIQLANLALLREMDYVCKQNNLKYWIDFGTLLGAVRHKGFIPWDDDVDLGMLREDYDKLIAAFNRSCRNLDIFADFVICANKPCQSIIKIQHKKCPHLFVDIFPYDNYGQIIPKDLQVAESTKIKNLREVMQKDCPKKALISEILSVVNKNRKNILNIPNEDCDYIWGIDFNHHWKNWFASKEMLFPLKEIEFENNLFPCINNIEGYLEKVYGNYMGYPKKFGYGHNMFAKLTQEELTIVKELRSECEKSFNIRNI